jgi:Type II CAAX prenyl endopeptidase Rce1-like
VSDPGRPRRLAEVAAFVAVWMAIGEVTGAGLNAYLLIGVPLTVAFQLGLRRRPIHELWVRHAPPIKRRALGAVAILLAIYPLYALGKTIADPPAGEAGVLLYLLCAVGGAAAAGYAFTSFSRSTWRWLWFCLATAGVIGALPAVFDWELNTFTFAVVSRPGMDAAFGALSFLLYLPALFVIEEVSFRAALGSHACHPDEGRVIPTAIYLAVLWGIWHAPILGWDAIGELIAFHAVVGTFLSIGWHNSGNLGVSATAHAAYDSVRTALL